MMDDILRKWEIMKETNITERPPMRKTKHTRQAKEVLETANEAINLIKAKNRQKTVSYRSEWTILHMKNSKETKSACMWKRRIEKAIQIIRGEISILAEILQRKYKFKSNDEILPVTKKMKQKLKAKSQWIRRFEKRRKFYSQNKMFKENTKRFYLELGKKTFETPSHPGKKLLRTSGKMPGRKKSVTMREQSG